ncbi:hypothetical protein [Okeania sp.]|uniref:hypothetical protein n=1 Tax=Okeania sp. TaxID=3100323 RepID=UPI002B4AD983|nr:hypothetical protein [Okeania sp.]MEB3341324.1 hypothetical protein [Okeania sp.]
MSTYDEIVHQAQSLSLDEQEHLLKYLAYLIEQRTKIPAQNNSLTSSPLKLKRWRGFVPKRVDAVEFQVKIKQKWDE